MRKMKYFFLIACLLPITAQSANAVQFCSSGEQKSFSRNIWQADKNARFLMLDNLLRTHQIRGLSREQVHKLIGVPESADKNVDKYSMYSDKIVCSQAPLNTLLIEYKNTVVYRYRVWQSPHFLETYKFNKDTAKLFPDLKTDLNWHYQ